MAHHKILITGGTGLIGKLLTQQLINNGYSVSHLSRTAGTDPDINTFLWDVEKGMIDEECIDDIDTIIHLAGAGIAEKRWTDKRKKVLIDSRTKSIGLIYQLIKRRPNTIKTIVSASATGYYSDRGDELMTEDCLPANDFLGECCTKWENAVDEGKSLGLRILKFRTGVVLIKDGGALPQLAMPVKLGIGSPMGNGRQWIPWIHWQDVLDMYTFGLEDNLPSGVYNMVAPRPATNEDLTRCVAKTLHRPFWAPNVPAFLLKLLLGEMSAVVLGSTRVSPEKIIRSGYQFKYSALDSALQDIFK